DGRPSAGRTPRRGGAARPRRAARRRTGSGGAAWGRDASVEELVLLRREGLEDGEALVAEEAALDHHRGAAHLLHPLVRDRQLAEAGRRGALDGGAVDDAVAAG